MHKQRIGFKLFLPLLILSGCSSTEMQQIVSEMLQNSTSTSSTSNGVQGNEIIAGLKEALRTGATSAGVSASKLNGYYANPRLFIPFPSEIKKVETTLNKMGMKSLASDFVQSLNRGAEEAAELAKPIFWKAISSMSIQDGIAILKGPADAATSYLKKTTSSELEAAFLPVVSQSLKKVNATRYWKDLAGTYNSIPLVSPVQLNLDQYVTEKALDGLFLLVADEEKKIRENPYAYSSTLLQKVFSKAKSL